MFLIDFYAIATAIFQFWLGGLISGLVALVLLIIGWAIYRARRRGRLARSAD